MIRRLLLPILLAALTAGCLSEPSPEPQQKRELYILPVTGCGSIGAPGRAMFAPGCWESLGIQDVASDPEVTYEVPINSTGLLVNFYIGAAAGRATVQFHVGDYLWESRFDAQTALTARFDQDLTGYNLSSGTWFHQYVGSVCDITEFTVRADIIGHYTTLQVEPFAINPQAYMAGPPLEPGYRASCNGFWSGNATTPFPNGARVDL